MRRLVMEHYLATMVNIKMTLAEENPIGLY